jgi:hypothetical protein
MSDLFFYLFLLLCISLMVRVIINPELIFEYPFFVAGIFLVFIVPQAIIIMNHPGVVPVESIAPLFAMCFLCLGMSVLGYYFAPAIKLAKSLEIKMDEEKLKIIGIVFTVFGYLFYLLMRREVQGNSSYSSQWSGAATIYIQFAQIINIAFPILLYLTLRKPNFINIVLVVLSTLPTLEAILRYGRRESTGLFLMTIALTVFYRYRIKPPRFLIVCILLITMLIIPAIGDYRKLSDKEGPIKAAASLDLEKSFQTYYKEGQLLELSVAAHIIDSYQFHEEYGYGAGYWDQMVFRYIPAQIIGPEQKRSLMLDERGVIYKNGYRMSPGLTVTGVGDSFIQFGYLGSIFFFFLGGIFRNLWVKSLTGEFLLVQILYMMCFIQAMLAVTHGTVNFLPGIFFSLLCLWLAARFAKVAE